MDAQEIIEHALKLDPAKRLEVIDILNASLPDPPDPEIERLWREEAQRRLAAHRSGEVQGIPIEDVLFGKR